MDVKGAFPNSNPSRLIQYMVEVGIDGDLVRREASFLSERKVQIVNLLMGFGVQRNQGICNSSFVDDTTSTARVNSVRELCGKLQKASEAAIELRCRNDVQFNAAKIEALLFMRKRGQELREQVRRARIIGGKKEFAQEATQHLGGWLHHKRRLALEGSEESGFKSLNTIGGTSSIIIGHEHFYNPASITYWSDLSLTSN